MEWEVDKREMKAIGAELLLNGWRGVNPLELESSIEGLALLQRKLQAVVAEKLKQRHMIQERKEVLQKLGVAHNQLLDLEVAAHNQPAAHNPPAAHNQPKGIQAAHSKLKGVAYNQPKGTKAARSHKRKDIAL
ncbi:unnamed protein product [Ilex paraguariensis]